MQEPKKDIPTVTAPVLVVENKDPQPAPLPAKEAIPTVTAPVLVVEAPPDKFQTIPPVDPGNSPTVWDTQKFRSLAKETALLILEDEKRVKSGQPIQTSNTTYLIAIVVMVLIGIGGISLIVSLRPDTDFLIVSAAVFGFITPTTLALMTFLKAQEASNQARETHLAVNSRLDSFIENAKLAAKAEGKDEGREAANVRNDERQRATEARADKLAGASSE